MKHNYYITLFLVLILGIKATAQDHVPISPNHEFRGVWVSTVFNLDWPKTSSAESQKEELRNLFDKIKEANLNVVFFQVRTECDAFYASSKEPWSRYLSAGIQGREPSYDPLQYAIEEAHKRGLELHAWVNPFRVNASTSSTTSYSDDHISKTRPEWIMEYSNGGKILDPGIPEVRHYIAEVVEEIVKEYAVDGIHFDDYFYSYSGTTNEDQNTYQVYGSDFDNIGDWRRFNINETIRLVNEIIKEHKPFARFGVSPFGIWKNGVPAGIVGMNAYSQIYADALHWVENHTVDYLTPQLYWRIGGQQDFKKLLKWWAEQTHDASRHLYAGHTLQDIIGPGERTANLEEGRMEPEPDGDDNLSMLEKGNSFRILAQSAKEVPNQIAIVRENNHKSALGSVFFRAAMLQTNPHGFTDYLIENTYTKPAVPPAMPWLPQNKPSEPQGLTYQVDEAIGNFLFTWTRSENNVHDFKRYAVYQLPESMSTISRVEEPLVLTVTTEEGLTIPSHKVPFGTTYWAIKEIGLSNDESGFSNVIAVHNSGVPNITMPESSTFTTENRFVRFEWDTQQGIVSYHFQFATDLEFNNIIEENSSLDPLSQARLFNNLENGTYYFRMRAQNAGGWSEWSEIYAVQIGGAVTSILQPDFINNVSIYPNPSKGDINLDFHLQTSKRVSLELISPEGKLKMRKDESLYPAGTHQMILKKGEIGAGFYMLRISSESYQKVYKVIFN